MSITSADEMRTAIATESIALTSNPAIVAMADELPLGFDPEFPGFEAICLHQARSRGVEVHYTMAPSLAVKRLLAKR